MLKLRAFQEGVAQPYRELRHFYVADRPFVLAYVQMAGETFSLWACLCGRDRDDPYWIVADDPRNRDLQSEAFASLAEVLNREIGSSMANDLEPLQIWVSNAGAGANLARIGRVMRARQVSDEVSLAGAYLDLYAQSMAAPTSVLCMAATEALGRQRATGQSDFEDANLASQLMWWDRRVLAKLFPGLKAAAAKAMSVFEAAAKAEKLPMGTLTSPSADEDLDDVVRQLGVIRREGRTSPKLTKQLHDALYAQVLPIWEAIWEARNVVSKIRESASASERWQQDSRGFRWQYDYLVGGGKRRFTDSPMRAAKLLAQWEAAQADAARDEVAEDRLALVEAVLDNEAVIGTVKKVEKKKIGKREHPFITLAVDETELTKGADVWWRDNLKVKGCITAIEPLKAERLQVTIHVTAGMTKHAMPAVGSSTAFITLPPSFGVQAPMPDNPPWTHRLRVEPVDDDE